MIITSLLDSDLYKFSMMQAVLHNFPGALVKYRFKCRNDVKLAPYADEIRKEIAHLCTLRFTKDELEYLGTLPYLKKDYIDFLNLFQLNENDIKVTVVGDGIDITVEGSWLLTIMFEVPVLAIVQEVYTRNAFPDHDMSEGQILLSTKAAEAHNSANLLKFQFVDFGTRRRFSVAWQEHVVKTLAEALHKNCFVGTSNVYLAKKYGLTPIGTHAHEWFMGLQQLGPRLVDSQKAALETWVKEYRGDLGIALSDVVGFDAFLRDFDKYFAKLYDGCRHDSGDPFEWGEKLIAHYQKLGIDPISKTAVFSDGLTMQKAYELASYFHGRIQTSFGVGTSLTNDIPGVKPAALVMKLVEVEGRPVAKISDSSGKGMCEDPEFEKYIKNVFQVIV